MKIKEEKAVLTIFRGVSPLVMDIAHTAEGKPLKNELALLIKAANKKAKEYPKHFKQ